MNNLMARIITLTLALLLTSAVHTQTTAFNYQGHLNNGAAPANGNYEMEFRLFDALSGGAQVGDPVMIASVTVINGFFTATLDFEALPFDPGPARWLEIAVRPVNNPNPMTVLSPRQPITSVPYAIQARNAATADNATNALQLGGIDASEYVTTATVGNTFIKNDTVKQTGNFNISGNGTLAGTLAANEVTAQTGTGFYGLRHSDGFTTVGTYVGNGVGGVQGGWFGTQSNSSLHFFTNNGQPRMTIDTAGNVGIGTPTPVGGYKLDVNGALLVRSAGTGGNMQLSTPNGETGLTISGVNRADVRYDGSALRLFAGTGTSPPMNGILINNSGNAGTSGNFGVGTFNPDTRLTLNGGPVWTSGGWTASMNLRNTSAIAWDANSSGQRFGIGQSTGGLHFFRSFSAFGTTASPAEYAMTISDAGNVTQPRDKGGLVKAMAYVNADATIIRCYNAMTNSSTGNCGFTVTDVFYGSYRINFGFKVDDRFVSVTAQQISFTDSGVNITTGFYFVAGSPNVVGVKTNISDLSFPDSYVQASFMIIVY